MPLSANLLKLGSSILTRAKRGFLNPRVLNPNASEASYKPKQHSYRKTKLKKIFSYYIFFFPGDFGRVDFSPPVFFSFVFLQLCCFGLQLVSLALGLRNLVFFWGILFGYHSHIPGMKTSFVLYRYSTIYSCKYLCVL